MFGNLCNQYSNVTHSGPVGLPAGSNKWEFAVSSVCYDLRWGGGGGCVFRVYLPMSLAGSGEINLGLEGFPRFYCVGQLLHQPMAGRARLLYVLLSFLVLRAL